MSLTPPGTLKKGGRFVLLVCPAYRLPTWWALYTDFCSTAATGRGATGVTGAAGPAPAASASTFAAAAAPGAAALPATSWERMGCLLVRCASAGTKPAASGTPEAGQQVQEVLGRVRLAQAQHFIHLPVASAQTSHSPCTCLPAGLAPGPWTALSMGSLRRAPKFNQLTVPAFLLVRKWALQRQLSKFRSPKLPAALQLPGPCTRLPLVQTRMHGLTSHNCMRAANQCTAA